MLCRIDWVVSSGESRVSSQHSPHQTHSHRVKNSRQSVSQVISCHFPTLSSLFRDQTSVTTLLTPLLNTSTTSQTVTTRKCDWFVWFCNWIVTLLLLPSLCITSQWRWGVWSQASPCSLVITDHWSQCCVTLSSHQTWDQTHPATSSDHILRSSAVLADFYWIQPVNARTVQLRWKAGEV